MDSTLEKIARVFPEMKKGTLDSLTRFESVTEKVMRISAEGHIICPTCGTPVNFNEKIEWIGPMQFSCLGCERLLHMSIIARALRDLGYVQ